MQLSKIGLIFIQAILLGQTPQVLPRVLLPGEDVGSYFWLQSPIIAIVKVNNANWMGSEIQVTPADKLAVRLVRVIADVEYVIKGQIEKGTVQFYFFANTLSYDGRRTVASWLDPGKRYIIFLRKDGDVLRTMTDVAVLHLRILSGRHDRLPSSLENHISANSGTAIAEMALSPTADHEQGFADHIDLTQSELRRFLPPADIAVLLRKLLVSPETDIRTKACLALLNSFQYRDPCVQRLIKSRDVVISPQDALTIRGKKDIGNDLAIVLRDNPLSLSIRGKVEELSGDLELFTYDLDAEVRKQACETLQRLFPLSTFSRCAAPVNP
jgi:hypothetical protein